MVDTDVDAIACAADTTIAIPAASRGASAPNIQALRTEILRFIVTESQPARLPGAWSFLRPADNVRQLTVPGNEFWSLLRRTFADEDLLATRVCMRRGHDLVLSPAFGVGSAHFCLQHDEDDLPVDVHGECGALTHDGPAAMSWGAARADSRKQREVLILAETMADLQVLRSLGFNAVISANLDTLDKDQLDLLFSANSADDVSYKFQLIVADWNIVDTSDERRRRARRIVTQLARAQQLYDLDPGGRFTLWQPAASVLTAVRAAASFRDKTKIQQILRTSLPKRTLDLAWQHQIAPRAPTLSTARSRLCRAITRSNQFQDPAEVSLALEEYLAVYDRSVTGSWYAAADAATSPGERLANLDAAVLAEQLVHGDRLVVAATEVLAGNHPSTALAWDSARLYERLKLSNSLYKAIRNTLPRK